MKILYLYSELSPYLLPIFKIYVQKYNATLHVVHWDHKKLTPYKPIPCEGVYYYNRSEYNKLQLMDLAEKLNPDIIYIAGWMDLNYLSVVKKFRKKGIPVVSGFDDIWKGNFQQRIGAIVFPILGKKYISHAFVSFSRQYEFAKRLGFIENEIIFNLLTCDTELFNEGYRYLPVKGLDYPKVFLFVGRFSQVKGIDILVKAFKEYVLKYNGDWKLICVGNGDLKYLLENEPGIDVKDFASQADLVQITKEAGAFVLPSRSDPSPLVVHECASAGLPLLLSDSIGTRSTFLIDHYNGISFKTNSVNSLAKAMSIISNLSNAELIEMSKNSYLLSQKVNPEIVAASFISIIK